MVVEVGRKTRRGEGRRKEEVGKEEVQKDVREGT